jgi:hypothetical protein
MPSLRAVIEKQHFTAQPFFVMNDTAYWRTFNELKAGEPFTYSYIGECPHATKPDAKGKCTCPRFVNKMIDGGIMRVYGEYQKPVFSESMFRFLQARGAITGGTSAGTS